MSLSQAVAAALLAPVLVLISLGAGAAGDMLGMIMAVGWDESDLGFVGCLVAVGLKCASCAGNSLVPPRSKRQRRVAGAR